MGDLSINDLPPNPYISILFHEATAKLSDDVAKAEESFIIKAIMLAGYEPIVSEDAEWRKHVTLHYEGVGRKVIAVDGVPKWAIITELHREIARFGVCGSLHDAYGGGPQCLIRFGSTWRLGSD